MFYEFHKDFVLNFNGLGENCQHVSTCTELKAYVQRNYMK